MKINLPLFAGLVACMFCTKAIAQKRVLREKRGLVYGEAEHFWQQTADSIRKWYIIKEGEAAPAVSPDGDPSHAATASNRAYVEVLPDTRVTRADKLVAGTNFSNVPGTMAILSYRVHFKNPGRYYVWVKAYSSGAEDNGLHVGIDGTWPESGRRMQWCEGKNAWTWASKQRTEVNHCGEPGKIFLDIDKPGKHVLQFSMREDGFETDQFILTNSAAFRPEGFVEKLPVTMPSQPKQP